MSPRYLAAAYFVAASGVFAACYLSLNVIAEYIIGDSDATGTS